MNTQPVVETVAESGGACEAAGTTTFALLDIGRRVHDRLDAVLGEVGLSMPKYAALEALVEAREPMTLSELAGRLCCVRSNVTQLVDRLESDGLVRRVNDPGDRRAIRAVVTEQGAESQAAGARAMSRLEAELADRVGPEGREAIGRVLDALR